MISSQAESIRKRRQAEGLEVKKCWYIKSQMSWKREEADRTRAEALNAITARFVGGLLGHTPPPGGTSMKVSILPLNSLWLFVEHGLGFRIFCGLGGRVGGLGGQWKGRGGNTRLKRN